MKVLYDHQIFSNQQFGGISRYFYELLNQYTNDKSLEYNVAIKYTNNHYLKNLEAHEESPEPALLRAALKFPILRKEKVQRLYYKSIGQIYPTKQSVNEQYSVTSIQKGNYDIFHPTYFDLYHLDYNKKPFVLTVYDMIHEKFPESMALSDVTRAFKKKLINQADHIITISKKTKEDLINMYDIDDNKVTPIYLANSLTKSNSTPDITLPAEFFLFVGGRNSYKNFYFFTFVLSKLIQKNKNINLVCTGGGNFTPEERNFFKELGIDSNVRFISDGSDSALSYLYSKALALVVPSMYEGFGLPVVEAFSHDCPVICSNNSSLKEIAGNAAVLIDPKSHKSIYTSLEEIYSSGSLRKELVQKGHVQNKTFTWEKTAKQTVEVYKSLI